MGKDDKELKKTTKKGLKVMRKTHANHPLREGSRILKYARKDSLETFGCRWRRLS